MNGLKSDRSKGKLRKGIGLILIGIFLILSFQFFDIRRIGEYVKLVFTQPLWLLSIFVIYGSAFLFRAVAWKMYLRNQISLGESLNGIFFSLFLNHLLPFKAGDIARAAMASRNKDVDWDKALHSVVVMRALDMAVLLAIGFAGFYFVLGEFPMIKHQSLWMMLVIAVIMALGFVLLRKTRIYSVAKKHWMIAKEALFGKNGMMMLLLVLASWVSEGIVVFGVAGLMNASITYQEAVWVNSVTVGGQVFQVAPGGIASYETVMSVLLSRIGIQLEDGYYLALISHGLKFAFSYMVGIYVIVKIPGLWQEVKQTLRKGEKRL